MSSRPLIRVGYCADSGLDSVYFFFVILVDEDRIFWRPKPKQCRNIPVSILPATILLDCRPVGDRSCGPRRRELDGKDQLIERGSSRRVRIRHQEPERRGNYWWATLWQAISYIQSSLNVTFHSPGISSIVGLYAWARRRGSFDVFWTKKWEGDRY
jgi:hypothetical protein